MSRNSKSQSPRAATSYALVFALLAACATPTITEEQYIHSLTIERGGAPYEADVVDAQSNRRPVGPHLDQIEHIVASDKFQDADTVLIFVHGGLNTLEDGLERTERIAECLEADQPGTYPIFVNWNSDLGSSYWAHLMHFRNGERKSDFWGAISSPFILLADLTRAVGRTPIVLWQQGYDAFLRLSFSVDVRKAPDAWREQARIVDTYEPPSGQRVVDGVTQIVPGLTRVITTPLADTFGFAGYDMTLRRIDTMFRTRGDLSNRTLRPEGAVTLLMERIPTSKKIVLIGHSMGTIALNELIRHYPDHTYESIVYMGAACTIHDFADAVPNYLRLNRNAKFYNLCLHPAAEANEVNGYSMIPNGSLLEWLDAFVLGPRTPFDRTLGKWNNAMECLGLLGDQPPHVLKRLFIKAFPVVDGKFRLS